MEETIKKHETLDTHQTTNFKPSKSNEPLLKKTRKKSTGTKPKIHSSSCLIKKAEKNVLKKKVAEKDTIENLLETCKNVTTEKNLKIKCNRHVNQKKLRSPSKKRNKLKMNDNQCTVPIKLGPYAESTLASQLRVEGKKIDDSEQNKENKFHFIPSGSDVSVDICTI